MFRFTALVTLSSASTDTSKRDADDHFASGTHKLMVQVWRDGDPPHERLFPAELAWSQEREMTPGDHALMTISIADPEARSYLRAGRTFRLWGACAGNGVVCRQVFTSELPS
jgi:hypothetical protein